MLVLSGHAVPSGLHDAEYIPTASQSDQASLSVAPFVPNTLIIRPHKFRSRRYLPHPRPRLRVQDPLQLSGEVLDLPRHRSLQSCGSSFQPRNLPADAIWNLGVSNSLSYHDLSSSGGRVAFPFDSRPVSVFEIPRVSILFPCFLISFC